ncbi:iron chelate uptake ABC transporter family permease subunit [Escherichia coli]|uniref:iron chelate uptake ABC transporter family permease subunit n=1 Tax=Escherichia coli TaxID=562 RepID=UPI0022267F79|nr:iron chelate uptake ABC transporter family permease subunit [Escherichia coli]MCW3441755.1 iron chelate uptake ABC transporter family permease subunit [Escherichia coli]
MPRTLPVYWQAVRCCRGVNANPHRNPLADPGCGERRSQLCHCAGCGAVWYSSAQEQLAMAFAGALVASLIVAFTGSQGGGQLSPVRLTLAGVALAAVLEGLTSGIALLNPDVYDQLRFWQAGSLIFAIYIPKVVLIGADRGATALLLSRALNSLSLGSDTATALVAWRAQVDWSAGDYRALW